VDSQLSVGRPHPPSGVRTGRADLEVQVHHQRKALVGMVLARRAKQGGGWNAPSSFTLTRGQKG